MSFRCAELYVAISTNWSNVTDLKQQISIHPLNKTQQLNLHNTWNKSSIQNCTPGTIKSFQLSQQTHALKIKSELLKVRPSQNYFFKSMFLPKNKQTNLTLLPWYLNLFSFVFWKKLETTKRHFEINWPLGLNLALVCFFGLLEMNVMVCWIYKSIVVCVVVFYFSCYHIQWSV